MPFALFDAGGVGLHAVVAGVDLLGLSFHRNADGTTTGCNTDTGFTVTDTDEEEVKRRLYEDAGWDYTPPPPPVPPGYHRFALVDDSFGHGGIDVERYASLRENPPHGCTPSTGAPLPCSASGQEGRFWRPLQKPSPRSTVSTDW
ncbi:hypothetical protein ACWCQZ_29125 [Streptomyces sp. NPDC002285]